MKITFMLILLCMLFNIATAQNCCLGPSRKRDTSYILPILIDTSLLSSDFKNNINLKYVYDRFQRDTVSGIYMYTFDINEYGKLEPSLYYDKNSQDMKEIQRFVESKFNHYKWAAGYKKNCESCKITIYMQLIVYLNTDVGNVKIVVQDIETVKNLFEMEIPYDKLKSF